MKIKFVVMLAAILMSENVLASTKPQKSDYFESVGGGFPLNGKELSMSLTVNTLKEIPVNSKLVVTFQNPKDKKSPLIKEYKVVKGQNTYNFKSDILECADNGKTYKISVNVINIQSNIVLSKHNQKLKFNLPEFLVKDRDIKSCK